MLTKVIDFFNLPKYESTEQSQKTRFLHIALLVATGTCILLGIENLPGGMYLHIFLFVASGISLFCIPANKKGYYIPVAIFISSLLFALTTYSLITGVGLKDAGMLAYPVIIVFTSYLFNKKVVLYTTLLSIGSVLMIYYFEREGFATPATYTDEIQLKVILVLLPAMGFLLWVVVDNLEKTTIYLRDTYSQTLSGWGQALEYHDRETQGHSQRVVEMTIELAKRFGIRGQQLEYIRQGVLLHDIGKMAIPDTILLKREDLSSDDWVLVKKHPIFAKKMLEDIPFLQLSLDIPYSHHERWDGSGYPEGLSGEQIPFAARIFAVVDVWDALISDRPYHQAWTEEQAINYIRDQSGKLFDPHVVEEFLELAIRNKNKGESR
ncbi:MAG: HD domain-containing phosphohydrolase [Anaerolineales bacterium]